MGTSWERAWAKRPDLAASTTRRLRPQRKAPTRPLKLTADLRRRLTSSSTTSRSTRRPPKNRESYVDYLHAIALGIIQGVAELFPVSSAAHTLIISALLNWPLPSLPFVVMLHLGTFLAVLMFFAKDFWRLVVGFFTGFSEKFQTPDQQLSLLVLGGTFPVAVIGKAGEPFFDYLFGQPIFAACFLLVTGAVLFAIERMPAPKPMEIPDLNPEHARMWY